MKRENRSVWPLKKTIIVIEKKELKSAKNRQGARIAFLFPNKKKSKTNIAAFFWSFYLIFDINYHLYRNHWKKKSPEGGEMKKETNRRNSTVKIILNNFIPYCLLSRRRLALIKTQLRFGKILQLPFFEQDYMIFWIRKELISCLSF